MKTGHEWLAIYGDLLKTAEPLEMDLGEKFSGPLIASEKIALGLNELKSVPTTVGILITFFIRTSTRTLPEMLFSQEPKKHRQVLVGPGE